MLTIPEKLSLMVMVVVVVVVVLLSCLFELFDSEPSFEVVSDFLFRPLLDDLDMRSGV